jgi:lipoprotein-releasing system ATP-binding protein
MLTLKDITKSFVQRGLVLNKLNITVNEGDTIAITGPSGSGKTTLLNIIGLLEKPDIGEVIFNGNSVTTLGSYDAASYRNRNIGFVFQEHLLLPHLSVSENIYLPLIAGRLNKEELVILEKKIRTLMEKTSILSLADKYPQNISGGEAQRVALVRALANSPSLLLADEPTGSLDTKNAELLGKLVLDMNRETGITVILATHSEALAARMKRRFKLEDGKLIEVN